jgi:hypothetical protein
VLTRAGEACPGTMRPRSNARPGVAAGRGRGGEWAGVAHGSARGCPGAARARARPVPACRTPCPLAVPPVPASRPPVPASRPPVPACRVLARPQTVAVKQVSAARSGSVYVCLGWRPRMGGAPTRSYADGWRIHPVSRSWRKAVNRHITPHVLRYGGDAARSGYVRGSPDAPGSPDTPRYPRRAAKSCR